MGRVLWGAAGCWRAGLRACGVEGSYPPLAIGKEQLQWGRQACRVGARGPPPLALLHHRAPCLSADRPRGCGPNAAGTTTR